METVLSAISFGLFAGLSPGPLMALVLTATLQRGFRAGALTAIAPLLTDAPVILLSLVVLGQVPGWSLSTITVAGGMFVSYLGVRTVIDAKKPVASEALEQPTAHDAWRGAMVNFLSPHPWIFWFTVGTPIMIERWPVAPWESIAFVTIFLTLLVGCKLIVAWATARGRHFVDSAWYPRLLSLLGVLLVGFGLWLVWQGVAGLAG
jgi:threonine/homoserine/homoserine lactone efflux protein